MLCPPLLLLPLRSLPKAEVATLHVLASVACGAPHDGWGSSGDSSWGNAPQNDCNNLLRVVGVASMFQFQCLELLSKKSLLWPYRRAASFSERRRLSHCQGHLSLCLAVSMVKGDDAKYLPFYLLFGVPEKKHCWDLWLLLPTMCGSH